MTDAMGGMDTPAEVSPKDMAGAFLDRIEGVEEAVDYLSNKTTRLRFTQLLLGAGIGICGLTILAQAKVVASMAKVLAELQSIAQIPNQAVQAAQMPVRRVGDAVVVDETLPTDLAPVDKPRDPGPREAPEWVQNDPLMQHLAQAGREPEVEVD